VCSSDLAKASIDAYVFNNLEQFKNAALDLVSGSALPSVETWKAKNSSFEPYSDLLMDNYYDSLVRTIDAVKKSDPSSDLSTYFNQGIFIGNTSEQANKVSQLIRSAW